VASVPASTAHETLAEPAPQPPAGYLDAVAGQPLLPVARRAWLAAVDQAWSDPARLHHLGRRAGILLDAARSSIARSLGVRPGDVYFTSSGPTALQVAISGLLQARAQVSRRAILSAVESLAVQEPVRRFADEVSVVEVDPRGRVSIEAVAQALGQPAAIICVQAANGEVGTRQPLAEVAALATARSVPLVVHAIQVIGRDPVPQNWDVLAASARDWGGPAGVGVLAVRPHVRWTPDQSPDRGWVGGFPDIPGAAAAAAALEYLVPHVAAESSRISGLIDLLRAELPKRVVGLDLAGDPVDRLPHLLTFTVAGIVGEALVTELDRRGVSVASGSACTTDTRMASQVLVAMGWSTASSIRVSLPLGCSAESVERLLVELPPAVAGLRSA
jgi:cysteine desulfurase